MTKQLQPIEPGEQGQRHRSSMSRRRFLRWGATGLLAAAALEKPWATWAAKKTSDSVHGRIVITGIEEHEIKPDYQDWLANEINHYQGPRSRIVYIVHTNKGFHGLGEGGQEPPEVLEKYIGSSPFDWIGNETSVPMGKAAGVPVYKLFGQRHRRWVPAGAWTVASHPPEMADRLQRYAARGYTWLKYHPSPVENVFDQITAMEQVAPEGFKIHFDLTRFHHFGHNPDLIERMSRSRIAGCFEDPLETNDIEGYVDLRKRIRVPLLIHGNKIEYSFEVMRRDADAYIVGHHKPGLILQRAGLFEAAGVLFMSQWVGGQITRAMVTHMQSAFQAASFPFQDGAEIYKSDVTREQLEPTNGFLRVPERPGLGVTLDRDALESLKNNHPRQQPPFILKTRFKNGAMLYNIQDPKQPHFMVLPNRRRLIPMSFDSPLSTEHRDDDGSPEFRAMFQRIKTEGMVLEKK